MDAAPALLDLPATAEGARWAYRLLHFREAPRDAVTADATLRALRRRLLDNPAEPDAQVEATPVSADAACWAYRILLGREPESEQVVKACEALPGGLGELVRNFRAGREFAALEGTREEGVTTIDVLGAPMRFVGFSPDRYFRGLATLGPGLERLAAVARAAAQARGERAPFEILDVGACLGVTAVALARALPGRRILALEPAPRLAALVRRNVVTNGWAGAVEVEAVALGAANGRAAFREEDYSAGSHLLTPAEAASATDWVPVVTLDSLAATRRLDHLGFVKLDIEGFERHALEGGLATLARTRAVIHMEFNSWAQLAMSDTNPRHFLAWLFRHVPFLHALEPDGTSWKRYEPWALLSLLHRHLVERRGVEDLVLSWDGAWAEHL